LLLSPFWWSRISPSACRCRPRSPRLSRGVDRPVDLVREDPALRPVPDDPAWLTLLPFTLQWSLGGFAASNGVSLWAFASALGALMFSGTREAVPWFGAYLALLAVSTALEPALEPAAIPGAVQIAFFAGNLAGPPRSAISLLNRTPASRSAP
jgi:hypothetical protein